MRLRRGSDAISPTAHYTGHIWVRNGLSHPELATLEGRVFYETLAPPMRVSRLLGGPTLEALLVARHRAIDELLAGAIDDGAVDQVVEIACGMSPRGWRFSERYGERLTYIEADLPAMAGRKRRALERMGSLSESHRVVELDALRDDGPQSLAELAGELDPDRGLALITEGLVTYFSGDTVLGMWRRFADTTRRFSAGLYLADLPLRGTRSGPVGSVFYVLLSGFVRGGVYTHFDDEDEAVAALRDSGFDDARLVRGDEYEARPGAERIHVVEARTG